MLQIEQRMLLFFQNLIFVPYINTAKNLKRKKKKKNFLPAALYLVYVSEYVTLIE